MIKLEMLLKAILLQLIKKEFCMKKKLLFKNTTKYSKKIYDDFAIFHNDKYSLSYNLFTIFILILLTYCFIMTVKNGIVFLAIGFALAIVGFVGYRFFNPLLIYKKESTAKAITKEKTFKFYFYNSYFKVRDNLQFDTVPYHKLYKVFETNDYFYLYLTKQYSFIIDKNNFTLGSAEEFSLFLKSKFRFRYSNVTKPSAL